MQRGATQPITKVQFLSEFCLMCIVLAVLLRCRVQAELEDAHKADPVQPTLTPEEQVRCLAAAFVSSTSCIMLVSC
jgi:hypothetical protein